MHVRVEVREIPEALQERGGDDEHPLEAAFAARGDQHPRYARIERQARELAAQLRQPVLVVHRAQLGEQRVAVRDGARVRSVQERKVLDLAEVEAQGAQDHRE